MINNSVLKAYSTIDVLANKIEKAEVEGLPEEAKQKAKTTRKKGLLSRSKEMFKYNNKSSEIEDTDKQQQKLVTAYVLTIRKAFEEVKNG
jgi:hypothetical protein|tara:strand:+ start:209 stop:478 length:270 start_codon:yes stop_codon:yes gene_type:complete